MWPRAESAEPWGLSFHRKNVRLLRLGDVVGNFASAEVTTWMAMTGRGVCEPKSCKMNTYTSLSKQTTLTTFKMNTYKKPGGGGCDRSTPTLVGQTPTADVL